ncbi:MAG: hypothetical protein Q9169_008749, partial [Polycauliona sp. 2 TL-2023]
KEAKIEDDPISEPSLDEIEDQTEEKEIYRKAFKIAKELVDDNAEDMNITEEMIKLFDTQIKLIDFIPWEPSRVPGEVPNPSNMVHYRRLAMKIYEDLESRQEFFCGIAEPLNVDDIRLPECQRYDNSEMTGFWRR